MASTGCTHQVSENLVVAERHELRFEGVPCPGAKKKKPLCTHPLCSHVREQIEQIFFSRY